MRTHRQFFGTGHPDAYTDDLMSRAPRMAPIRGSSGIEATQQRDDLWTRRSHHPDPPVDVMPALRKPEPGPGLVSEFDPTAAG